MVIPKTREPSSDQADSLNEILGAAVLQPAPDATPLRPQMSLTLDGGAHRPRSSVSRTLELDPLDNEAHPPRDEAYETAVEGVPVVGRSSVTMEVDALAPTETVPVDQSQTYVSRHHALRRIMPLAIIAGVGLAVVTFVSVKFIQQDAAAPTKSRDTAIVATGEPVEVSLPAVTTLVGMSDDNKEAWLSLCFRVSEHAQTECRLSYLRASGEYPGVSTDVGPLVADALEVSNAHYAECVARGACTPIELEGCRFYSIRGFEFSVDVPDSFMLPQRPAVCASFEQASAYCEWRGMRLPTMVEWERLARGEGDGLFPWRGSYWAPGILNWGERDMTSYPIPGRLDGAEFTTNVSEYQDGATVDGIYNLLGNAAEWVLPNPDTEEGMALMMGGSYVDDIRTLRVTSSEAVSATQRRSTLGFRCVGDGV